MEDKQKENLVETKSYFSQIKKINFKSYVLGLLLISVVILIWGYFYSVQKVQWEKPDFPTQIYENASDKYKKLEDVNILNYQDFQKAILNAISNKEKAITISDILRQITKSNTSKMILFQQIILPLENAQIKQKYDESKNEIVKKIEQETDYYKRRNLNSLLNNYDRLLEFAQNAKITAFIDFPRSENINKNQRESFTFVAGTFTKFDSYRNEFYCIGNFRPVLNKNFIKKSGIALNDDIKEQLKQNENKLEKIINNAKNEYNTDIKNRRNQISETRERYRKDFYSRWFSTLILLIVSFIMYRILIRYFSIIRRKALPKKTTYDVYFATNTTSIVVRWIALIVIILGILSLIINALTAIISGELTRFIPIPLFHSSLFFYKVLHPIFSTLSTVIASWIFVLIAEQICFVSNLYHIVFEKVYGKIKD